MIYFYDSNKEENQTKNENTVWKMHDHDALAFPWSSKDISTTPQNIAFL